MRSYRPLIWFWGVILSLGAGGAATLQLLGPLGHDGRVQAASVGLRPKRVLPPAATDAAPSPPSDGAASPAVAEVPASAAAEPPSAPAAPERRVANPASPSAGMPAPMPAPARPYRPRARQVVRRETVPAEPLPSPAELPPSPVEREQSRFIGVYATGPDGVRVFRSNP